ncbi:NYN domain-containing protein [bacterium]|nr:NYN domain-containing protein [bacterium]
MVSLFKRSIAPKHACLLLDFENLLLGVEDSYPHASITLDPLIDLARDKVPSNRIQVARAYADWKQFGRQVEYLLSLGIKTVQAPSYRLQGRNGTDIQMAVEAIELLHHHPELHSFILVTGDSDFNALVLALKEHGRRVIGVGVEGSVSPYFEESVDEFHYFGALCGLGEPQNHFSAANRVKSPPSLPTRPRRAPQKTETGPSNGGKQPSPAKSYPAKAARPVSKRSDTGSTPRDKCPSSKPASGIRTGNGPSGPRGTDYLDALDLQPQHLVSPRLLRTALPLVAETIQQAEIYKVGELRKALAMRYPDEITRQEAGRVANLLQAVGSLGSRERTLWMERAEGDPERLLEGFLAVLEARLIEKGAVQGEADPKRLANLLFKDNISYNEVQMRLVRGRNLLKTP